MIYSPSGLPGCTRLSSFRWVSSELYLGKVLALSSFVVEVNGCWDFEAQKAFIKLTEPREALFMMDEHTLLRFGISTAVHFHCRS